MNYILLLTVLFAQLPTQLGSEITIKEREFSEAKEVEVEPVQDKVLLFTTELKTGKKGLWIEVKSKAKYVVVRASTDTGTKVPVTKLSKPNTWVMEGKNGKYNIEVIEFDPELGIAFTDVPALIGTKPEDPPPPPPGDYKELGKLAKTTAIALNDKETANNLGRAYEQAVLQMKGKTLEECASLATKARFDVLNNRKGISLKVNWNGWLTIVDKEFVKLINNDPVKYAEALAVIAEALISI